MINIFQKIHDYLYTLDTKDFYKNIGIFLGANVLVCAFIMYASLTTIASYKNSLQEDYKKEQEAAQLLRRLAKVKKQSEEINTILEQEPTFRIKNFYDDTIKKLNLEAHQRRQSEVSEEDILSGRYTEIKLNALLNGIDTHQLCNLLQTLEEKDRIYMKELVITKKDSLIDVNITIATLTLEDNRKKAV